jgi:hypothetical protein
MIWISLWMQVTDDDQDDSEMRTVFMHKINSHVLRFLRKIYSRKFLSIRFIISAGVNLESGTQVKSSNLG